MHTVYIIDDDEDVLNSISRFLRHEEIDVKTFTNFTEFKKNPPVEDQSVMIVDMQLQDATGLDLQNYLLTNNIHAPILFISGNSQPQQIISALKQGAHDFLLKPIDPSELLKTLNNIFERLNKSAELPTNLKTVIFSRDKLTEKEYEVANFIKQGFSNKAIGEMMNVKADTIKKRRAQIYLKLQCKDLPEFLKHFN